MQGSTLFIVYALIFVVVVMAVEALYLLVSDSTKNERIANQRIALINKTDDATAALFLLKKQDGNFFNQRVSSFVPKLKSMLWAANVGLTVVSLLMVLVVLSVFLSMLLIFIGRASPLIAVPLGVILGSAVPLIFLHIKAARRRKLFSDQLCPAIDLVCRSLQAGHPAVVALELVSREMPDPIGTEFGIAMDETNYGLDRNVALCHIAERFPDPDLRFFISALEIQRTTGANLVEILKNLTQVIRGRVGMRKKIAAMSAEGRFTAFIVGLLPFFVTFMIILLNPTYYKEYSSDPLQIALLVGPAFLYVIGMFWMWRMVNIRI